MLLALALAAAAPAEPKTAIDAERAFARDAQTMGQWRAFEKWTDGSMFVPELVTAKDWLKDRPDPPVAVQWWPAKSFVSCDGIVAVNVGPWVRKGGQSVGYFTTVWEKERQGWRWRLDHGDALAVPMAAGDTPVVRRASCRKPVKLQSHDTYIGAKSDEPGPDGKPQEEVMAMHVNSAPDLTLIATMKLDHANNRHFVVEMWNGRAYETVLEQRVKAQ